LVNHALSRKDAGKVSDVILKAFLNMVIGKTNIARIAILHLLSRNMYPAITLVINKAILDRMPLHCLATSMATPPVLLVPRKTFHS
jgi:hypothetical protein